MCPIIVFYAQTRLRTLCIDIFILLKIRQRNVQETSKHYIAYFILFLSKGLALSLQPFLSFGHLVSRRDNCIFYNLEICISRSSSFSFALIFSFTINVLYRITCPMNLIIFVYIILIICFGSCTMFNTSLLDFVFVQLIFIILLHIQILVVLSIIFVSKELSVHDSLLHNTTLQTNAKQKHSTFNRYAFIC